MKRTSFLSFAVAAVTVCSSAFAAPYCPELSDVDSLPKSYQKRGPFYSDRDQGWIIGADQLSGDYAVTDEVRALWTLIGQEFAAQGTQLVVLSAPPRPLSAGQKVLDALGLADDYDPEDVASAYSNYIAALNAAGLAAPDLSQTAQSGTYYFTRDTHWTPRGAYDSVAALAQHLTAPDRDTPDFAETYLEKGSLSAVADDVCGTRPEPETVLRADYPTGSSDLFGETDKSKIALIGTSFSDRYQRDAYQVADAVAYAFDADVTNHSLTGGGMSGAMTAFLEQDGRELSQFDVIIWETPYTTPLLDTGGLRQVLGTLRGVQSTQAQDLFAGALGQDWQNIKHAFEAQSHDMLLVRTPGVTTGTLSIELFDATGGKTRVKLVKSKRVPPEARTENWVLALDALPNSSISRVKLKLKSKAKSDGVSATLLR